MQPLSKIEKFFMGKPTAEEYAKNFNNVDLLEKIGIDFSSFSLTNFGGINWNNAFKGVTKALGLPSFSKVKASASNDEL